MVKIKCRNAIFFEIFGTFCIIQFTITRLVKFICMQIRKSSKIYPHAEWSFTLRTHTGLTNIAHVPEMDMDPERSRNPAAFFGFLGGCGF